MKKMFLSVAVLASTSFFVNAVDGFIPAAITEITMLVGQDGGFTEAKLDSLNGNVQKAIEGYSEEFTVKKISYNSEKKLAKVIFVSEIDQSEKIVIFDDEGQEVK